MKTPIVKSLEGGPSSGTVPVTMRATPIAFFLLAALFPSSAWTQEVEKTGPAAAQATEKPEAEQTGPTSTIRGKRVDTENASLFSDAEIGDLYEKANKINERSQPRTENFYAVDAGGPIIELEPYTVEGDDGLLMARVRREMDRRPESVQRRLAELSPRLAHRAQDDLRAQNRIMDEDFRAGPNDVPSTGGMGIVGVGGGGEVSRAVGEAIRALFAKE